MGSWNENKVDEKTFLSNKLQPYQAEVFQWVIISDTVSLH